ncbi:MAG: tyrosine--tRNA ligase [Kistimonas sp.]|nr:tyrosine--tRNA ligase [Kistimonas sp.]
MLDTSPLLNQLQQRALINQVTDAQALASHLGTSRTLYCGFDPTADSLHLGHLVPLLVLRRFQQAGHRPVALVGGATGLIGDPSFKSSERKLNGPDVVAQWSDKIRSQLARFVDFDCGSHAAVVANNLDWTHGLGVLDFLRDTGKHFSVNAMIQKEAVKQRLERTDSGVSFTEFSYALLQALDFVELNRRYDCTVQIGGSDQWGNIVGGIDLVRRRRGLQTFGMTTPLVTRSDGVKFGKTEAGAVWLDARKTSPYTFYQFWLNVADADVYNFLHFFTFLSLDEIESCRQDDARQGGRPLAQTLLAREVTRLVHGADALASAERITQALFSGRVQDLETQEWQQLCLDGLPCSRLSPDMLKDKSLVQLLTDTGLAPGRAVRDAMGRGALWINDTPASMDDNMQLESLFSSDRALCQGFFLVRIGKKKHWIFEMQETS